jgi:hypothetical protein
MFLAKTLTIVLAILAVITMMVAAGQRRRHMPRGSITVTHLNRELDSLRDSLQRVVLDKFAFKKYAKAESSAPSKVQQKLQMRLKMMPALASISMPGGGGFLCSTLMVTWRLRVWSPYDRKSLPC